MIFLKKIEIINFLSHKSSVVEFKENQRLLISGASGSGKSSIIDAILWNLYGKGRSENKNLIKNGSKTATVLLTLSKIDEDGADHTYVITRSVTSAGRTTLAIIEDGKLIPAKGVKETQDTLEKEILKASYTLFVNSIASPQDNPDNFVKQTASKKKDLLLEIANTDNYDLYYNKIKESLSESNDKILKLETKLEEKNLQLTEIKENVLDEKTLEKEEEILKSEIKIAREKISVIEKEKNNIDSVMRDVFNKKQELSKLENDNITLQNKIDEKKESVKKFDDLDEKKINDGITELKKAQDRLKELDEIIHNNYSLDLEYRAHLSSKPVDRDFTADANQISQQLELIYKNNDITCPFCGKNNPRLEENISKQVNMLKNQLAEKIAKRDDLSQQLMDWELRDATIVHPEGQEGVASERKEVMGTISQLEHFVSDLGLLGAKKGALQGVIEDVKYFADTLQNNVKIISNIKSELSQLQDTDYLSRTSRLNSEGQMLTAEIGSKESELHSIIQKISLSNNAKDQVSKLKEDIKAFASDLKKLKDESSGMNLLKDAFSPKGIKTIVIDYLVPKLEDKINAILQDLSDFRIQIETQKDTSDGEGVVEGLFINIINPEGVILEYSNYSGGEKMRVDYALSEAMASLSNIKFRILDESIGALDEQMLSSFLEILEKMSGGYKQLIAISHIGQVKELFEDQITVTKKDGTSIIN